MAAANHAGDGIYQGPQQGVDRGVEGEELGEPESRIPGDEAGGQEEVHEPEAREAQEAQGPGTTREAVVQGPEQDHQHQQQQLVPELQAHAQGPWLLQESAQARIGDGLLLQQAPPLHGGQGVEGREEDGHGAAVEQHRQGEEVVPGGGGRAAYISHCPADSSLIM